MKICFVTNTLGGGGAEKQLLMIVRGLMARGIPCEVFVIRVLRNDSPTVRARALYQELGVALHEPQSNLGVAAVIARLSSLTLTGRRNVIIWTWGYRPEAIRLLVPILWLGRGIASFRDAGDAQIQGMRWLLRLGRRMTWRYVSNSRLAVEMADRVAPGVLSKARVVYNAIEPGLLSSPMREETPRSSVLKVRMLGNVRFRKKGYDIAIAVAARIKKAELPIRIEVGGVQPSGEPLLSEEIRHAQVGDIMNWMGPVTKPAEFLAQADAFMLLSRHEGMPNALLEAMALGLACVASEVGDLKQIAIESKGALQVVPVGDADAAFLALVEIWQNWPGAVFQGQRAQAFCRESFSEEKMIDSVIEVLELTESYRKR